MNKIFWPILIVGYLAMWVWNPLHLSPPEFSGKFPHADFITILGAFIYLFPAWLTVSALQKGLDSYYKLPPHFEFSNELRADDPFWEDIPIKGLNLKYRKLLRQLQNSKYVAYDFGKKAIHLPHCARPKRNRQRWFEMRGYERLELALSDGFPKCDRCLSKDKNGVSRNE